MKAMSKWTMALAMLSGSIAANAQAVADGYEDSPEAADYSVAIVPGGLNLYSITKHGIHLVGGTTYVLKHQAPISSLSTIPVLVAMNPAHDFVYVEYVSPPESSIVEDQHGLPSIVGLQITPHGLVYKWSAMVQIQGYETNSPAYSLVAGRDYVLVNNYPGGPPAIITNGVPTCSSTCGALFVQVIKKSGEQVFWDAGVYLAEVTSAHFSPTAKFFYACIYNSGYDDANGVYHAPGVSVSAYSVPERLLEGDADQAAVPTPFLPTSPLQLVGTSTDSAAFQSECK